MKKTLKNLLVIPLLLVSINVLATDGMNLKVNDKHSLVVNLQKIEEGAMLSLLNENGEILYKDQFIEKNDFTRIFDFKALANGEYTVILDREYHISYSKIRKNEENLVVDNNSYELVFKPLYRVKGGQVSLYLANPEENKVEIKIFDKFGVPVGKLNCKDLVVRRKLDFSEVPPGNYTVEIKTKTNNFTKTLVVG